MQVRLKGREFWIYWHAAVGAAGCDASVCLAFTFAMAQLRGRDGAGPGGERGGRRKPVPPGSIVLPGAALLPAVPACTAPGHCRPRPQPPRRLLLPGAPALYLCVCLGFRVLSYPAAFSSPECLHYIYLLTWGLNFSATPPPAVSSPMRLLFIYLVA